MKENYQRRLEETLAGIAEEKTTPSLLLHSCCAPCSSYVMEYLSRFFRITVFYYNPNIDPEEEYQKRVAEERRFLTEFPAVHPVSFLEGPYQREAFETLAKGLEEEPEGGARCPKCYELRLRKTAEAAKQGRFDYFTTTLSVSPYKNAQKLNEIGGDLAAEYGIPYLFSDFKKKNGYQRSIILSRQYGLYRQDYCGCSFSRAAAEKHRASSDRQSKGNPPS